MRAIASGGKYRLEPGVTGEFVLSGRGRLDDPLNDAVGRHPLAFGREADDDPMPQHRAGEGLDVFHRHMAAALQERTCLGADDQKLHGPRPRAPGELVTDKVGGALLTRTGLPDDCQRIPHEMVAHRHTPHGLLQALWRRQRLS